MFMFDSSVDLDIRESVHWAPSNGVVLDSIPI